MKYRVIDTKSNKDITDDYEWFLSSDGDLFYRDPILDDFHFYLTAKAIPVVEDWNEI